jgi:hypothetical protein
MSLPWLLCGKRQGGPSAPAAMTGLGAVDAGVPISIASAAQPDTLIQTAAMDYSIPYSAPWGQI